MYNDVYARSLQQPATGNELWLKYKQKIQINALIDYNL